MDPFVTRRKVEFADTDMGGVVHFSRYAVYMETAEHEFLRSRGLEVDMDVDGRRVSWPRVKVTCEYASPARYGDTLDIHVRVLRVGEKSVTYGITFTRDGTELARGETTAVCCAVDRKKFEAVKIPEVIRDKLDS